jgi:uncharacterized membrane protein YkvI
MPWARRTYRWLIWLFLLGLAIQFLFAGLGTLGGESIEPHRGLGNLLILISLVLAVLAAVARLERPIIPMTIVLLLLTALQILWAQLESPMWLRSFHVFDAFLLAGLADNLARKVGFPLSSRA